MKSEQFVNGGENVTSSVGVKRVNIGCKEKQKGGNDDDGAQITAYDRNAAVRQSLSHIHPSTQIPVVIFSTCFSFDSENFI